jgi:hypothetical protein
MQRGPGSAVVRGGIANAHEHKERHQAQEERDGYDRA